MHYERIQKQDQLDELKGKTVEHQGALYCFSPYYIEGLKQFFNREHCYQYFARDDNGAFVGYIAATELKPLQMDFLWILELCIVPTQQRKGFGSALVQQVIDAAKKKHFKGVIAQTDSMNLAAKSLYYKLGFVDTQKKYVEGDVTYELLF